MEDFKLDIIIGEGEREDDQPADSALTLSERHATGLLTSLCATASASPRIWNSIRSGAGQILKPPARSSNRSRRGWFL